MHPRIRRRISAALSLIFLISMFLVAGPLARPARAESTTVALPKGFIKNREYRYFLDRLSMPDSDLTRLLVQRDEGVDESPAFWQEIQALAIARREQEQYQWALHEMPDEHNFKIALKPILKIIEMYNGFSLEPLTAERVVEKTGKSILKLLGWKKTVKVVSGIKDAIELYPTSKRVGNSTSATPTVRSGDPRFG